MKPKYYILFIVGLFLIGAGIYLSSIIGITHPFITIGITITVIGALLIVLSLLEVIESLRNYRVHSKAKKLGI